MSRCPNCGANDCCGGHLYEERDQLRAELAAVKEAGLFINTDDNLRVRAERAEAERDELRAKARESDCGYQAIEESHQRLERKLAIAFRALLEIAAVQYDGTPPQWLDTARRALAEIGDGHDH